MNRRFGIRQETRLCFLAALICILISPPSFLSFQDKKSNSHYWVNTLLTFDSYEDFLSEKVCYQNKDQFLGCMNTITVLASLIHDKDIELSPRESKISKGISGLNEFDVKTPKYKPFTNIDDLVKEHKIDTDSLYNDWKNLYKTTQNKKINFLKIANEATTQYKGKFQEQEIVAQAVNAFLSVSQSPHDHITPLDLIVDEAEQSHEEYLGIGVILRPLQKHLIVVRTIPGGPADQAGLLPGDLITHVQEQPVADMLYSEANQAISRLSERSITLTYRRSGSQPKDAIVKKDIVQIDNVVSSTLESRDRKWGLIRINTFQKADTCSQVEEELYDLEKDKSVSGLVLDLRDNPGGLVDQSLCIADLFLPNDYFMLEVRPIDHREKSKYFKTQFDQVSRLPIVVLINSGSASSAEILAGVLRDHDRAILLGDRTFGKGSILRGTQFLPPKYPNLIYYQTYAKFYFPSGRTNHLVGLNPDFEVSLGKGKGLPFREEDLFFYSSTLQPGKKRGLNRPKKRSLPQFISSCLPHKAPHLTDAQMDVHKDVAINYLSCVTAKNRSGSFDNTL